MSHHSFDHYYHVPPPAVDYNSNEIKTLFISGLPEDVKAREIHNLFRHRPGFEACQLKYTGRGDQVVAFAVFYNHQLAIAALHALHGVKFDPQTGSALHIELARTNSWRARKAGDGPYVVIDNRKKISANVTKQEKSSSSESEDDEAGTYNSDNNEEDDNDKSEEAQSDGDAAVPNEEKVTTEVKGGEKSGNGQACSTLFIANLGPTCSQDELKQVLSKYPGFNVLKLRARSGMPVAFADFEEVEQATKAMEELEGSVLESSDRGGMHIEYARSKMRKPWLLEERKGDNCKEGDGARRNRLDLRPKP